MEPIACPHSQHSFTPAAGQAPPWCRRCGGDFRARAIGSTVDEELVPLTAAPAGRWANRRTRSQPARTRPARPAADAPDRPGSRSPAPSHRPPPAEVTHQNFDYETAVRAAGYESTRPSLTCYAFAGLCLLLPVAGCVFRRVALFLGVSGAGACVKVAHSHGMPLPRRILACAGIVALTWGTYLALVVCLLGAAGVFGGAPPPR